MHINGECVLSRLSMMYIHEYGWSQKSVVAIMRKKVLQYEINERAAFFFGGGFEI